MRTMGKVLNEVKSFPKTLVCFSVACLLLPLLLLSFVFVYCGNELVTYVLSMKYPTLTISKSRKIRSLIDTPRNAGVFHFLLQVSGACDPEEIKQHYEQHLTNVRDKDGKLRFPKLRQQLVTCWGHYAWVNDTSNFNINNHIFMGPSTFRGRLVNDSNVEEFVSDLVTKYIPSNLPQWQVILIPISTRASSPFRTSAAVEPGDHYYILLKIHHLIIAEEEDLHISEMLMLQDSNRRLPSPTDDLNNEDSCENLSYFVRKPVHIRRLLARIAQVLQTRWSQFVYEFESLETPDGYGCGQITKLSQLLSVLLIVVVNGAIHFWKSTATGRNRKSCPHSYTHKHTMGRLGMFRRLLLKEADRHSLTWRVAYNAVRASCHPANLIKTWAKFVWQLNANAALLPYHICGELRALCDLIVEGQTGPSTLCGQLSIYLPMLLRAHLESLEIGYEIFKTPLNVYEQLIQYPSKESNILQMKSYSGRKIVSFSKAIDAAKLRERVAFEEGTSEFDFTLSCLAGAIHDYFEMYTASAPVPKILNTTCRTIAKGYFSKSIGEKTDFIGGVVFLQLPLGVPNCEHVRQLHASVEQIRRKQIMIYLLSVAQTKLDVLTALVPHVLTKICINYFSFHFPVTITEIHGATADFETLWGQAVQDVMLFRPPQSKTCLSLNIHRFGGRYRLAIMADTQLGPDHSRIARSFESYMENFCP